MNNRKADALRRINTANSALEILRIAEQYLRDVGVQYHGAVAFDLAKFAHRAFRQRGMRDKDLDKLAHSVRTRLESLTVK